MRAGPSMLVTWYEQWVPGTKKQTRLPVGDRVWKCKEEGSRGRRFPPEREAERLAALRSRFVIGDDGYLRDLVEEMGAGVSNGEAGVRVDSVPCMLWMYCDSRLRCAALEQGEGFQAPDAAESAFLLDQVLVQDAAWEFTHASATDGSRMHVEGTWEVGRAAVLHNGLQVSMIGGKMLPVEDNFVTSTHTRRSWRP